MKYFMNVLSYRNGHYNCHIRLGFAFFCVFLFFLVVVFLVNFYGQAEKISHSRHCKIISI